MQGTRSARVPWAALRRVRGGARLALDPVLGPRAAEFWSTVPYLDPSSGDHKIIWELNRHQHLLVLGRA